MHSLSTGSGCSSVIFPTFGVPYTKVCGRARGYQYGSPDGFYKFTPFAGFPDVEGLIVTHGSPRNHIWSFVAGRSKDYNYPKNCPCASPYPGVAAPSFVGNKIFFASLGTLEHGNTSGTLMTLCGTHRGVEVTNQPMRISASINLKCLSTNTTFMTPYRSVVAIATSHHNCSVCYYILS